MKKRIISLMAVVLLLAPMGSRADVVPHDVATIEALIELHKTMMDMYKSAMQQEEVTAASQFSVKEMAKKYNNVMSNLHQKMENGYATLQLAAEILRVTEQSVKALRNFKEFSVQGLKLAQNKPFALIRYADVANNCNKRVKRIKNLVLSNAEVTGNLLRCDDSERMKFIYLLGSEIDGLNDYLDWQLFSFQMINAGQLRYDTIWEIMNSEVLEKTAAEVIALMI